MIELPPSDLNILIEECHSLNEDIHSLLVQSTINSTEGSRIVTISKRAEFVLSQFMKLLLSSEINLPVKVGN